MPKVKFNCLYTIQATITRNDFQTLSKQTISTPCAFLLDAFEQSDTLINIDDVTKKVVQNIDIKLLP